MSAPSAARRTPLEVSDIFRAHSASFCRSYNPSSRQLAVVRHIEQCRTAALGGHVDSCDSCGHMRISYNSCRDRHCPKCQSLKKAAWLEARLDALLPVNYFHVVFTIPDDLNLLALRNKAIVYDILFRAASETLLTIAADPHHLGAQIGFTAILHTWGQNLLLHPHLHCVVTGGGLSADGSCWVDAPQNFFLPVRVLAAVFRGKFLQLLSQARDAGQILFEDGCRDLADEAAFRGLLRILYEKDWVVYAKPPFGGPQQVFSYLGRYTHRVAISNSRLVEMSDGRVSFTVKDYADNCRRKLLSLDALEFIRRFLLHVLPRRFIRIRHFGLMASRNVSTKLARCRRLLAARRRPTADPPLAPCATWQERLLRLTGVDLTACPACGRRPMTRRILLPSTDAPERVLGAFDSS